MSGRATNERKQQTKIKSCLTQNVTNHKKMIEFVELAGCAKAEIRRGGKMKKRQKQFRKGFFTAGE